MLQWRPLRHAARRGSRLLELPFGWTTKYAGNGSPFFRDAGRSSSTAAAQPDDNEILFDFHSDKLVIGLNRVKALNALTLSMIDKIRVQAESWITGKHNVQLVMVKSANDGKAFCAGGDVVRMAADRQPAGGSPYASKLTRSQCHMMHAITSLPMPYVSIVNGICMGGGAGLALHGSFCVASEKAVFAMPEMSLGYYPDVLSSYLFPRLRGRLGLFLALTGTRLTGRQLTEAGIASHFVSSQRLPQLEHDLLALRQADHASVRGVLQQHEQESRGEHDKESFLRQQGSLIDSLFTADSVEEIIENLQQDASDWSKKQLQRLAPCSPTSLKVTFREMKEGSSKSLDDCLRMEYRMALEFFRNPDCYEGVRASKQTNALKILSY